MLAGLDRGSLRRELVDTSRVTGIWALRNSRRLLSFCCNDYLNLTHHPPGKEAEIAALRGEPRLGRRRRLLPPGDRQPPAVRGARGAAGALEGHGGGLHLRLGLPRQ